MSEPRQQGWQSGQVIQIGKLQATAPQRGLANPRSPLGSRLDAAVPILLRLIIMRNEKDTAAHGRRVCIWIQRSEVEVVGINARTSEQRVGKLDKRAQQRHAI